MADTEEVTTEEATAATSSLEEYRKTAVPRYRQPGVCRRKRIVCCETEWDRALQQLKDSMEEYCALGFDVECVNVNNPRQVHPNVYGQRDLYRDVDNNVVDGFIAPLFGNSRQQYRWLPSTGPPAGDFAIGREGQRPSYLGKMTKAPLRIPVLPNPQHKKRRKEVAVLLQLATWSGLVIMLRLCFWRSIPDSLREFLSDPRYIKLGVGIENDAERLYEDWGLQLRGWIDLRHICIDMCIQFNDYPMRQMGLKKLAEGLFGASAVAFIGPTNVKKARTIAWSDWNAARLTQEQIRYASWDAQIAVDIFALCTQRLYQLAAPQRESKSYYDELYKKCSPFLHVPPSRHPRPAGEDSYDDDDWSQDYLDVSIEDIVDDDNEELNKFCTNSRSTGNRGFLPELSSSPRVEEVSTTNVDNTSLPTKAACFAERTDRLSPALALDKSLDCSVSMSSLDKKSGIAVITLNHPPKNLLDFHMAKSLVGYIRLLEDTEDCRGVIIASACSNTFSGGFELKELRNSDPRRVRAYLSAVLDLWFRLYKTRLVTAAAINGLAGAGGFVMAACCDRRIMASDCGGVGFSEVKLGITLPLWIVFRVVQLVGQAKAEFILSRGHLMDAEHALEYGLIDRVSPKDRLLDAAVDEVDKILDTPDSSRLAVKWALRRQLIDKTIHERERCLEALTENVTSTEVQELIRHIGKHK